MKKFNILMISGMTFFTMLTCQKEDSIQLQTSESVLSKMKYTDFIQPHERINTLIFSLQEDDYESNHYLIQAGSEKDTENYIPPFEVLEKLLALMLEQDLEVPFLDGFLDAYGSPIWNESFFKPTSDEERIVVSVPFIKQGELTGILKFYNFVQGGEIRFINHDAISQVINDQNYNGGLPLIADAILDMLVFEYNIENTINNSYLSWLDKNNVGNTHSEKGQLWCITYHESWTQIVSSGGIVIGSTTFYETITECFYQSGIGGDFPNNWPGVTPNDPNTDSGGGRPTGPNNDGTNNDEEEEEEEEEEEDCLRLGGVALAATVLEFRAIDVEFNCGNFATLNDLIDDVLSNISEVVPNPNRLDRKWMYLR